MTLSDLSMKHDLFGRPAAGLFRMML